MSNPVIPRMVLLVGCAAFIPLPFVDELVRRYLLAMCFEEQARMFGRPLPDGAAWRLSRRRSNLLVGCLLAVFWWPVKKLFRTMIFFLLVKDAIDWATDAAVRTAMVRRALERDVLPGDAEAVWVPLDRCSDAHVASPVIRALLDPLPPPEPWRGGGSGLDGLLAWLVRWGRGHAALVAFDEALPGRVPDRIPASSPPALPEE